MKKEEASFSKDTALRNNINRIISSHRAETGAGIMDLKTGDTMTFNNNKHFPMQSVFKFPLGMAVLALVDSGQFALDQKIGLNKNDLLENTYSPLRDKYHTGNKDITLSEILEYTVSLSDNNGCDKLFRLTGGPEAADRFVKSLGINEIQITTNEEEMHRDENAQFTNWSTPYGMLKLLEILDKGSRLSASSNQYLTNLMVQTPTGPQRIKGMLPSDAVVAHKTGSSGTNENGISQATNDAGIVSLTNGKKFAIVVFVSNSIETPETNERIIAEIAKTVYDYFKQ